MTDYDHGRAALEAAIAAYGQQGRIEGTVELYQAVSSFLAYMEHQSPDEQGAGILQWLGPAVLAHLEMVMQSNPKKSGLEVERDMAKHLVRRHLVQDLLEMGVKFDVVFECAAELLAKDEHPASARAGTIERSYAKADAIERSYYLFELNEIDSNSIDESIRRRLNKRAAPAARCEIPGIEEIPPARVSLERMQDDPDLVQYLPV